ncbi:hypothetical protein L615_008300000060 [Nocardioides sp. J9]|uniref:YciI family protein n=1 Tax=unclassified Nocardioides TaxID=2615069 RepID=UPI0004909879|nr:MULTISPECIES: YciI family protein [unclassified Nocardioides]TWG91128.1 hypothetical protein L615_008300000060 [Nocardioides sp. J9]
MTQYLLSVHGSEEDYANIDPQEVTEMVAAVDRFNDKLQADGVWVFAGGLETASTASVVDASAGDTVVTDGPYLETKEHIGGFWILELPDRETALRYAAEGSVACRGKVEVRPFQAEPPSA